MQKDDQVAIAVDGIDAGEPLPGFAFPAIERVPPGHKVAVTQIAKVTKCGAWGW